MRQLIAGQRVVGMWTMTSNLPPSGHPAVDAIRHAVERDSDWDTAENENMLHFYILRAAQNIGRFEPYTPDEAALNAYLKSRMAGKRLCDFAWRMLAQSVPQQK